MADLLIEIESEVLEALERKADALGISVGELARRILTEFARPPEQTDTADGKDTLQAP